MRYEEALAAYDRGLALQPDNKNLYYEKAATLLHFRHYKEALRVCERCVQLDPTSGAALELKSLILQKIKP